MNDQFKAETILKSKAAIKENYEDSHWLKKYGVSADELKQSGNTLGIQDKIIKAAFNHKVVA